MRRPLALLALLHLGACGAPVGQPLPGGDASAPDDAGGVDAGMDDAGGDEVDGGGTDAGATPDAGGWDAGGFLLPDGGNPYAGLGGLSDAALLVALFDLVKDHRSLGYAAARRALFTSVDVRGGELECVYTGRLVTADGTTSPGGFNTEHSWPQSEGAGSEPARSDLHALFPTDSQANSARSSYPFGETSCSDVTPATCFWMGGGSELGIVTGGSARVFEVRPVRRGDLARAHFYFSVRYRLPIPASEEPWLRAWHRADWPDALEAARTTAIEALQGNRNSFVDRPDLVDRITDF